MINVTVQEAQSIVDDLRNGVLEGISAGKNGRAWLSGEFQLCELEAIFVLVRAEAGENAEGAEDAIEQALMAGIGGDRMTPAAKGRTYLDFRLAGWTKCKLIECGYMV